MPFYQGTPLDDQSFGSTRVDVITGGFGRDAIWALAGNEFAFGNADADADSFVFTVAGQVLNDGPDWGIITDFNAAEGDKIDLSNPCWLGVAVLPYAQDVHVASIFAVSHTEPASNISCQSNRFFGRRRLAMMQNK